MEGLHQCEESIGGSPDVWISTPPPPIHSTEPADDQTS